MRNAVNGRKSAALVLIGSATLLGATVLVGRPLNPDSRLWVEGTSSVRSYKCVATTLESAIELGAAEPAAAPVAQLVQGARVSVAVEALDCANGTMNGHMQKALRMKDHPRITFTLDSYTLDGADAVLEATLEMAGSSNPVRIPATVTEEAGGIVRVAAQHEIRMTEWGVKPPSLMLGAMKVHDPVTIHFDVTLQR
jgi:polyisoprenoid-binding protein YceI